LRRRQPFLICGVKDIADDGKPFWAWWEFTERSLSKSGYEPEDETKERSDKASRQARHQTRDFRKMLSTHRNESSQRQRRRQDIVENTTE